MERFILISLVIMFNLCLGIVYILKPGQVIEHQKRFYAKINWRMEPISMEKEIRNTRVMGGLLIMATLVLGFYAVIR